MSSIFEHGLFLTIDSFYLLLCSMLGGLVYSYLTFTAKSSTQNIDGQEVKIHITNSPIE